MLRPIRHLAFALCLLPILWGLTACSETPSTPRWQPLQTESTYRLLFNDALVAHVLFQLSIDADGGYRIEAFTSPAGQMRKAEGHRVLEVSTGTIDGNLIRPQRFDHSEINEDRIESVQLLFDWPENALHLQDGADSRRVTLLPGTQDRLSYLLAANALAHSNSGGLRLAIATRDATEDAVLDVIGQGSLNLPLGKMDAIGIRRISSDPDEHRELWFSKALTPLPLRVVRHHAGNTLDMQLETVVDLTHDASDLR